MNFTVTKAVATYICNENLMCEKLATIDIANQHFKDVLPLPQDYDNNLHYKLS